MHASLSKTPSSIVFVCSETVNKKDHLPILHFKVPIAGWKHTYSGENYTDSIVLTIEKCFYIVKGIFFLKLTLQLFPRYLLVLWFTLTSKIKPKEEKKKKRAVYAHRWHLPYIKVLFSQRLQTAFIALESIWKWIQTFLRLKSRFGLVIPIKQ